MASREVEALRRAVDAAKKVVKKPIIETGQPEPTQVREVPQANA